MPIIAVTSYALSGDEAKTREAGCDGYIAKPFSPRQLLAKIREFLPNKNSFNAEDAEDRRGRRVTEERDRGRDHRVGDEGPFRGRTRAARKRV